MKSKRVNGIHGIKEANKNFILRVLVKPHVSVAFIWCIKVHLPVHSNRFDSKPSE
jgi:hypothetical protein